MTSIPDIDSIVRSALSALAADTHIKHWKAKENDWVNYFVFRYLIEHCRPGGLISHPAQIGIEVTVPQPPGYERVSVRRDVVLWPSIGMTCWGEDWMPSAHPLAIIEWKVHRPLRRNRLVDRERKWLRSYCRWQRSVVGYAVEVDGALEPMTIACSRYLGGKETPKWLEFSCG